jgi:hypothetical protein
MITQSISSAKYSMRERTRDFLLVSSFGLWALLLGVTPVLAFHLLLGS